LEEPPCKENVGIENAGIGDVGIENAGICDVGIVNAGICDVGIENAGIGDVGIENAGMENAGIGDDGMEDIVVSADVAIDDPDRVDPVIGGTVTSDAPARPWAWAACPSVRMAAIMPTRIALIVSVLRQLKPLDETNSRSIVIQGRELKISFFVQGGLRERLQPDSPPVKCRCTPRHFTSNPPGGGIAPPRLPSSHGWGHFALPAGSYSCGSGAGGAKGTTTTF
jgi:hypothetical protein